MTTEYGKILSNIRRRCVSQSELDRLADWSLGYARYHYPTLPEDAAEDCFQEAVGDFYKARITNEGPETNYESYYRRVLASKCSDYFRSLGDTYVLNRVKAVLAEGPFTIWGKPAQRQPEWRIDFWVPDGWGDEARAGDHRQVHELQVAEASFADAGIRARETKSGRFLIHTDQLLAYVLHLFALGERLYGRRIALRAEDIKDIICDKMWIVPIVPASTENRSAGGPPRDVVEEATRTAHQSPDGVSSDSRRNVNGPEETCAKALQLEFALRRGLADDGLDIRLWLLYMKARYMRGRFEDRTFAKLENDLKRFPQLPEHKRQSLNNYSHKLAQWMSGNEVDIGFEGSLDVVLEVLEHHFGPMEQPVPEDEGMAE